LLTAATAIMMLWWVPSLVIVIYAALISIRIKVRGNDPAKFAHLGDELYFLGYLCTITSLAWLIWNSHFEQELDAFDLLRGSGMALSATIFGLVLMVTFRSLAENLQSESIESNVIREASDEILQAVRKQLPGVKAALGNMADLAGPLSELKNHSNDINHILDRLNNTMKNNANDLNNWHSGAERLYGGMKKLGDAAFIKETFEGMNKAVSAIKSLGDNTSKAEIKVSQILQPLDVLCENTKTLAAQMKTGAENTEEFKQAIMQLDRVLTDFAKLMESEIPNLFDNNSR